MAGILNWTNNQIFMVQSDGTQWFEPEEMTPAFGDNEEPHLCSGPFGCAHLFWHGFSYPDGEYEGSWGYCFIHPDGSWERYYYPRHGIYENAITVDSTGRISLVYCERFLVGERYLPFLIFSRMDYPGAPWTETMELDVNPKWPVLGDADPAMTIDPFNNVHISYTRLYNNLNKQYQHVSIYTEVNPFQERTEDEFSGYQMLSEDIISDIDGNIYLFMIDCRFDDTYKAYYAVHHRDRPGALLTLFPDTYYPGDRFDMKIRLQNNTGSPLDADLYICLDIEGQYFWYPSWSSEVQSKPVHVPTLGIPDQEVISFTVPDGLGDLGPYAVYAAMVDPVTSSLLGDYSTRMFRFRN